jgi:hypothetical protein
MDLNINIKGLGELTKPATILIEKVSDAIGGLCKPWQMKRVAEADAMVEQITAKSDIEVINLRRRALRRFLTEEEKKQQNIESITEKALPLLGKQASPQNMEADWITNFFDKSRIVSDEDMQQFWAMVLAGEANSPGRFSRKTINVLADIDRSDAEAFTLLCTFSWMIMEERTLLIYSIDDPPYTNHGINFGIIAHLEHLGLLTFAQAGSGFLRPDIPKTLNVDYFGKPLTLTFQLEGGNKLDTGLVLMTRTGLELASVCKPDPLNDFFEYMCQRWGDMSLLPNAT